MSSLNSSFRERIMLVPRVWLYISSLKDVNEDIDNSCMSSLT